MGVVKTSATCVYSKVECDWGHSEANSKQETGLLGVYSCGLLPIHVAVQLAHQFGCRHQR